MIKTNDLLDSNIVSNLNPTGSDYWIKIKKKTKFCKKFKIQITCIDSNLFLFYSLNKNLNVIHLIFFLFLKVNC